jgi:hypothetical protein
MSSSPASITAFHHWLMAEDPQPLTACSIVLHGSDGQQPGKLATDIASYLNEFDDDSVGNWLAFEPELVEAIAANPGDRRLLGLGGTAADAPLGPAAVQQVIRAIADRGHAVLDTPLAAATTRDLRGAFHVALGPPAAALDECHMILNARRFGPRCLAPVIGDTFLEWVAQRRHPLAASA